MAEILLKGTLTKLAGFTVDTVLELCGVHKAIEKAQFLSQITKEVEKLKTDVEKLNEELSWIKVFIEDADKRCIVDETQKKLVKDLIEIAYHIEDVVDVFFLECPTSLHGLKIKSRFWKKILKFPFLFSFQEEIINTREKIASIHKNSEKYNPQNLGKHIDRQNTQSDAAITLDPIGDPEVVGFGKDIKKIIKKLCDADNKDLAVVSIVGPGGIGKSTLARKVCHSADVEEFGEPIWITISQNYDLHGVLKEIAQGFNVKSPNSDVKILAKQIAEHLKKREKKYLIVLDDVWKKKLCDELIKNGVLSNTNNGSRVLITTRSVDVARYADTRYEPYKLNLLNDDQSLDLFLKNAIPKSLQRSRGLSPNINDLAKKFIKKCKGLPLALIVLGRVLSTRPCNCDEWEELLATMSWQDDGIDECSKVIATSFEHLPFARKFCFMYFAVFPEDRKIEVQPLIRMWIAEGLIPPEQRKTLEQTANRFLEDLVQRYNLSL